MNRTPFLLISLVGWLAFTLCWSAAARNSSPAISSESGGSRRIHEIWVNVALLLLFIRIPGLNGRFLPDIPLLPWIGLIIQALFGSLAVWARRHLGAHWSGKITVKVDHQLIQSGPYRFLRHPIYTAMLGMFIGTAVVSGEWHAALGVGMVIMAYLRKIRLEENNLRQAFGPVYDSYRRGTWALFPPLF